MAEQGALGRGGGMIYGSVCSGIEAATVAWHPLGWKPAFYSEIEAFPRSVLTHHYPDVPLHGDFTLLRRDAESVADIDLLVGGTPCQAFSVAGLRKSLDDDRGNLTLEFVRLADAIDDVRERRCQNGIIVVWENVPGVLSTKDNAFGCFLAALVGADAPLVPPKSGGLKKRWKRNKAGEEFFTWTDSGLVAGPRRAAAWRVLDAQYFGLAQRRERVFVVACPRGGADPSQILFEPEGVRRHSPPRREAGASVTQALTRSLGAGGADDNRAQGGFYVPVGPGLADGGQDAQGAPNQVNALSVALRGRDGGGAAELGDDLAFTLRAPKGGGDKPHVLAFGGNNTSGPIEVSAALTAHGGPCGRMDFESETFVLSSDYGLYQAGATSPALRAAGGDCGGGSEVVCVHADAFGRTGAAITPSADAAGNVRLRDPGMGVLADGSSYTLMAHGRPHAVCVHGTQDPDVSIELAHALGRNHGQENAVIAFSCIDHGADAAMDVTPTMRAMSHSGSHANAGGQLAICVTGEVTHALTSEGFDASEDGAGRGTPIVSDAADVRRLTVAECCLLQGFDANYTAIPTNKLRKIAADEADYLRGRGIYQLYDKGVWYTNCAADGPQYRALGNSKAVRVVRWLGLRIDMVEALA
jgi:DNA (cytosine-5)-methyltransferase 1